MHLAGGLTSAGLIPSNTAVTTLTDLGCPAFRRNGARPLFHFLLRFLLLPGVALWGFVENDRVAIPLFSKCLASQRGEPGIEDPSTTDSLAFSGLRSIRVHPSFDPTTKLLSIRSIWTSFGRILHLVGFKTFNPLRINEPIKSSPSYMYQFHLSILFALHNCNSIARHSAQVSDLDTQSSELAIWLSKLTTLG